MKKVHLRKNPIQIFLNECLCIIKGFKFQPGVCNGCHDLLMISKNLSGTATFNIKSTDYRGIISGISKYDTINVRQNIDLRNVKHYKI